SRKKPNNSWFRLELGCILLVGEYRKKKSGSLTGGMRPLWKESVLFPHLHNIFPEEASLTETPPCGAHGLYAQKNIIFSLAETAATMVIFVRSATNSAHLRSE